MKFLNLVLVGILAHIYGVTALPQVVLPTQSPCASAGPGCHAKDEKVAPSASVPAQPAN